MRITTIEQQKKERGRRNLYVDGMFVASVSTEVIMREGLRVGDPIDTPSIVRLCKTDEVIRTRNAAMRFLSYRPRTVHEVRARLLSHGFVEQHIRTVITDLLAAGLLDDAAVARMVIRDAISRRPVGQRVLKRKLSGMGIGAELSNTTLVESLGDISQNELAQRAAATYMRRRSRGRTTAERQSVRAKLSQFLGRRGFGWEEIRAVLKIYFDDTTEGEG